MRNKWYSLPLNEIDLVEAELKRAMSLACIEQFRCRWFRQPVFQALEKSV
jgi:hypothetical protein